MKQWLIALLLGACSLVCAASSDLMLPGEYQSQNIDGWLMSEKLDGVRGFWDGQNLLTRSGAKIDAPQQFTNDFPPFALDGELWTQRGDFENISASIRKGKEGASWATIKLYVFDVPDASGTVRERLQKAQDWKLRHPKAKFEIIEQKTAHNKRDLMQFLQSIEQKGGEGVIVRDNNAAYESGRSANMLKVKSVHDAECTVIAHIEGKGKYRHKTGALLCRNEKGDFKIGSGLSDDERAHPPKIGTIITYRYRGFTKNGKPRFATFLRVYQP